MRSNLLSLVRSRRNTKWRAQATTPASRTSHYPCSTNCLTVSSPSLPHSLTHHFCPLTSFSDLNLGSKQFEWSSEESPLGKVQRRIPFTMTFPMSSIWAKSARPRVVLRRRISISFIPRSWFLAFVDMRRSYLNTVEKQKSKYILSLNVGA